MILANTATTVLEPFTDNHWIPTVHIKDAAGLDFIKTNPGVTASFTAGEPVTGTGDAVASFSSRGPVPGFLGLSCCPNTFKPDVVAPGHQTPPMPPGVGRRPYPMRSISMAK